jgi:uncharacterized protein YaaQ
MFKLIIAIIRDSEANGISNALIAQNFRATRIASTGAFFRQGSTTLIIGVEAERVDEAIAVIKSTCGPAPTDGSHRVTLFVLNTSHYEQI